MIKNKSLQWALFICMAIAQLAVPIWMIYSKEKTKTEGKIFKFELTAIDPYDPFRGKYIILNPKENSFKLNTKRQEQTRTESMYATFVHDSIGFAKLDNLSNVKPAHPNYIKVATEGMIIKGDIHPVTIRYPFDRYYMNEYKAKSAEDLTREISLDSTSLAYAVVAVLNGKASLISVEVDGLPIESLLNESAQE